MNMYDGVSDAYRRFEWPYNFIYDIYESDEIFESLPDDIMQAVNYILYILNIKDSWLASIAFYRYEWKLPIDYIADVFKEDFEMIEESLVQLLIIVRKPIFLNYISNGINAYDNVIPNYDLSYLYLSPHTIKHLNCNGIQTIRDLMELSDSDLLNLPGIGQVRYTEIISKIDRFRIIYNETINIDERNRIKANCTWPLNFVNDLLDHYIHVDYEYLPKDIIPSIEYILSTIKGRDEFTERAIVLHYRMNLSYEDIAHILQKSEIEIEKLIRSGRSFIKSSPFLMSCIRDGVHQLVVMEVFNK